MEHESEQHNRRWVINLCSLAAPMVIPQPRASRLTRFSFFLSRYRDEGRHQYRLHMGYFTNVEEAQKWLTILKKVYPQACIGAAPASLPDLLTNTQALRILELGQVGTVQASVEPLSETTVSAAHGARTHTAPAKGSAPARKPVLGSTTLEDTLNELRKSEFNMGGDDDPDSTGVRHLRFEVQKQPGAGPIRRLGSHTRK